MKDLARWNARISLGVKCLFVASLILAPQHAALAQEDPAIPKWYLGKGSLQIPIQINERVRPQIQEVYLYVKEGPQAPWKLKEKVPGTQHFFTFAAGPEGEYWLNLATVDRAGHAAPADMTNEPARLIVVVDSTPPQAEVQVLSTNLDGTRVRCEVRDPNLDASGTRFFYQRRDTEWRSLACVNGQPDVYCIPFEERLTGMVRVIARDLAGNVMSREFNLAVMPVANDTSAPPASAPPPAPPLAAGTIPAAPIDMLPPLPVNSAKAEGPVVVSEKIIPFSERIELVANKPRPVPPSQVFAAEEAPPAAPPSAPPTASMPAIPASPTPLTPSATTGPGNSVPTVESDLGVLSSDVPETRHFVSNTHVLLDYQIEQTGGSSNVGRIEIWVTRDLSKSWEKLGEDINRNGHTAIDLPGEGVYGVTVVAANSRGLGADPPKPGDSPDWWIEVDTNMPRIDLVNARCDPQGDNLTVHIAWAARDKNLQMEPIDIFYAGSPRGPWLTIAKGLKNDGMYHWKPPVEVGAHAYVRVTARDRAGNTASAESAQAVTLDDLSRPRVRLVGITTVPRIVPGNVGSPVPGPRN